MTHFLNTSENRTRHTLGKILILSFASVIASFSINATVAAESNCVLQISQPILDYGRINRTQLLQGGVRVKDALIGKRTINLSAICESKTGMALSFRGESANGDSYRFARDGTFKLKILSAQLDGKSVQMIAPHSTTSDSSEQNLRPGASLAPYDVRVLPGERLSVQIEVETRIDSEAAKVRTQEEWQGEGQFVLEAF